MRIAVVTVSKSVHTKVFVEYLVSRGHDVSVITNRPSFGIEGARTVDTRPLWGRRFGLSEQVRYRLRDGKLGRALESGSFDVVNVQMMTSDGITAALTSTRPVMLTLYGSDFHDRSLLPAGYADRFDEALRRAETVHVPSEHMAGLVLAAGVPADRIEVFQYGIDLDRFRPGTPPPRPAIIVSTRSLRPLYRVHLIVEAMPEVLSARPDAHLDIYDSGDEEAHLRELVDRLGLSHAVRFAGRTAPDGIAHALGEAAVWVSMAASDGTPLSMLEAMAAGAWPVVGELETLQEWLSPERATLVRNPTAETVARGLIEGLDRARNGSHIAPNRDLVVSRADRARNLERFERLLEKTSLRVAGK